MAALASMIHMKGTLHWCINHSHERDIIIDHDVRISNINEIYDALKSTFPNRHTIKVSWNEMSIRDQLLHMHDTEVTTSCIIFYLVNLRKSGLPKAVARKPLMDMFEKLNTPFGVKHMPETF